MPRALVFVPAQSGMLVGSTPIGPGYPRSHRPDDMRQWANGLERLYRDIEARGDGSAAGRTAQDAHRHFLSEPAAGIKGSLRDDGRVVLDGGRHRAHYLLERGTDPVPVWVSARDSDALARFQGDCHAVVDRYRPDLLHRNGSRDARDDARPGRDERDERER